MCSPMAEQLCRLMLPQSTPVSVIVHTNACESRLSHESTYSKKWWKRRTLEKFYYDEVCSSSDSESENFRGVPNGAGCSQSSFSNGRQQRSACSSTISVCRQNEGQGLGYAASDTGVSSMYSDECDEEWLDGASEASHEHEQLVAGDGELNYHSNSSSSTSSSMSFGSAGASDACCTVPQKKYKFFGRKPFPSTGSELPRSRNHEEAHVVPHPIKVEIHADLQMQGQASAMQDIQHNHSYSLSSNTGLLAPVYNVQELGRVVEAKVARFKPRASNSTSVASSSDNATSGYAGDDVGAMGGQVTSSRDERRARELGIPIPTEEIVRLSIDEFNERLTRYELSDEQLALIRDIRRRGKNKVAAQNCRKRKLDQISTLQYDVDQLNDARRALQAENEQLRRLESLAEMRLRQLTDLVNMAERQARVGNQTSPVMGGQSVRPSADSGAIPKHSTSLKL